MKLIDRYVARNYLWPFFFCFFLFIFMFIFADSLNNLDEFLKQKVPFSTVLTYYAAFIPLMIGDITPIAILFSALYAMGRLQKNHEITALRAGGVSPLRILAPLLVISMSASVLVLAINEIVVPAAAVSSAAIKKSVIETGHETADEKIVPNVALLAGGNRMIFARELRLDTNSLYDIVILVHRADLSVKTKTTAKKGIFDGKRWTFYDVISYDTDRAGNVIDKPHISPKQEIDIRETPVEFVRQGLETDFMNYRELKRYLKHTSLGGEKGSQRILVDLYNKIAQPFMCFIILLVGAAATLRYKRGGAFLNLGVGLAITAGYYLLMAVSLALGKKGLTPPFVAAWIPHLTFLLLGSFLLRKNS